MTNRRNILQMLMLGGAATALAGTLPAFAAGYEVTHTEAEWRKLLSPSAYHILREQGTEQPYSSPLLNEHRKGTCSRRRRSSTAARAGRASGSHCRTRC